jgi:hypothetical protein
LIRGQNKIFASISLSPQLLNPQLLNIFVYLIREISACRADLSRRSFSEDGSLGEGG